MSSPSNAATSQTATPSSNFKPMLDDALAKYKKKTRINLLAHWLTAKLKTCTSVDAVLEILQDQAKSFEQSGDQKLMKWIDPLVRVLHTFSNALNDEDGLAFPPTKVIFTGIGILLHVAKGSRENDGPIIDLFEHIESLFRHLGNQTQISLTTKTAEVFVKIVIGLLSVLSMATKAVKWQRDKRFSRKLLERQDISDALKRLDSLIREKFKQATAQTPTITTEAKVAPAMGKRQISNDREEVKWSLIERDIRKWFSPPDPSTNYNRASNAHQEGSSAWFLLSPKFREWMSNGSLLWVHGKLGSGKSILCSAIIKRIMALRNAGKASLAFFYFDFWDRQKQNFRDFVTSLLVQLSADSSPCCQVISRIYSAHGDGIRQLSNHNLANCLWEMLFAASQQPIYIIVDALDECPDYTEMSTPRQDVLRLLEGLVRLRRANLHICVTSRPNIEIRTVLEPLASSIVSLHDENGQKEDISNYVWTVVNSDTNMETWSRAEKELVVNKLPEKADGMYLWVSYKLEELRHCPPASIRQILDRVPEALVEAYVRALHQIPSDIQAHAHRMLQCLVAAVRSLRVEELAELLAFEFDAIEGGVPKYRAAERLEDRTQAVLSTCSSLITVTDVPGDDRPIVKFSHFSVKEYLTSNRLASSLGDVSRYHVHLLNAHTTLAQASLGLLLHLGDDVDKNNAKGFPLAEYAAKSWAEHAKFEGAASRVKDGIKTLFDPDKPHFATWIGIYDMDRPEDCERDFSGSEISPNSTPNPLYYAALCGFYDLVEHLALSHPEGINTINGRYGSPLFAALSEDHMNVAELLLEHGANVDALETTGETMLVKVLLQRQRNLSSKAKLLLEHGADVDARDDTLRSPLHLAECEGELEVAQILLDHGANVNSQDIDGKTPLHILSESPTHNEENVLDHARSLLKQGADVNTRDKDNQTPLLLAVQGSRFKLARILLEHEECAYDKVKLVGVDKKVEAVDERAQGRYIKAETVNEKVRHRSVDRKEQGPPSLAPLPIPIPPPTATRRCLRSSSNCELSESPVSNAATKATQPINSINHSSPQSTGGASARLPAISLGVAAPPATSEPAQPSLATLAPPRSLKFPERVGDQKSDGRCAIAPPLTRWNKFKCKRTKPIEKAEGYTRTRHRALKAIGGALGMAAGIGHEALFTGVDLLQFAPAPGLNIAGKILLSIWDAVEMVETNRVASLRLIERCASILISIRDEITDPGCTIAEGLAAPIEKLVKAFEEVHSCLRKLAQYPFLKRYLKRSEIRSSILACDTALNDAREAFNASVQIRILKLVKELRQERMPESLSHVPPSLPPPYPPLLSAALQSFPTDPEMVRNTLHALREEQNALDRDLDAADMHQLMRAAIAANDDVAMIEVLQIARSEMPDAIRTLERALEHLTEGGRLDTDESATVLPPVQEEAGNGNGPSLDPSNTGASPCSADTLDRKFIETGIESLRRLSKGADLDLPSWTITEFEVDLEEKVGIGFFSEVFRGTWRKRTVAIKMLNEVTPRKAFLREVKIWKSLHHPNVLELFGASSTSGEPPWFLVCKYYPRGNLVKYLKGLSDADAARIDAVKMIYGISKGMAYLHEQDVLHGDLKAINILVDNDTSCVISDFGQSEMKSEVYRLTGTSQPRGTLRWQAPELMEGAQRLTPEMDVYAFAICCWEILNMGALPWLHAEDSTVRHLVLNKDMRPELLPSNLVGDRLINVIRLSWDRVPSKRPSFEQIVRELRKQRTGSVPIASTFSIGIGNEALQIRRNEIEERV